MAILVRHRFFDALEWRFDCIGVKYNHHPQFMSEKLQIKTKFSPNYVPKSI